MKIENDSDLEAAFSRLDEIWLAKPGDMDHEERCGLIDDIERYEDMTIDIGKPIRMEAERFRSEQVCSHEFEMSTVIDTVTCMRGRQKACIKCGHVEWVSWDE